MNPLTQSLRERDGRWIAVFMLLTYFGSMAIAVLVFHGTLSTVWRAYGVGTLARQFEDFRAIAVGVDRFMASDDRWSPSSLAFSTSSYHYTKWWLLAGYLGVSVKTAVAFSIGIIFLFYLSVFYVLGPLSRKEGFLAGLVLVSPNLMTGIERANADLVIFLFMSLVLAVRKTAPLAAFAIIPAAMLKIYPTAALCVLFQAPWRKNLPWFIAALAVIFVALLSSLAEFHAIAVDSPHFDKFSFGSTTILVKMHGVTFASPRDYNKLVLIGGFMFLGVTGYAAWKRPALEIKPAWEKAVYAFQIGASLFIGTFALGSNFDYRCIVFIFCLPFLFILAKETGPARRWALTALTLMIIYCGWPWLVNLTHNFLFYPKQIVVWTILGYLAGIFAGTFSWFPWKKTILLAPPGQQV